MAFLTNPYALILTANLTIQIIVLFLLAYGYLLKRKLQFRQHGITMSTALFLHLTMALVVMIPSLVFAVIPQYIVPTPLAVASVFAVIHAILGTVALTLGVWIVSSWRFRKSFQGCFNRKKTMVKTLTVWVASLIFGIILYSIFIGPVLNG